jgi:antirestriction protein
LGKEVFIMGEPALYCGTYAKYNNGSIAGRWLKLTDYADAEEFLNACKALHKDEDDPEFMFQDFEHMPRAFYSESLSRADLDKIYAWLQLDEFDRELVEEYAEATGNELDGLDIVQVRDAFLCVLERNPGQSDAEAMGDYVLDNGLFGVVVPDELQPYIDRAAIGRDYLMDMSVSNNWYVFTNC